MAWNGSGTYVLPPAFTPEVNGTTIDAARYNGTTNDLATGITAALAKNGENVPTANLPMGGFKHTGAGDGSAAGNYIAFNQATAVGSLTITTLNGTTFTATGVSSAAAFIPTSATIPTNGLYLKAANNPAIASNTTLRWDVNSTGNHTFAVPTSGDTLAVNGQGEIAKFITTDARGGGDCFLSFFDPSGQKGSIGYTGGADDVLRVQQILNLPVEIWTNNTQRVVTGAAGNVTINAPSSGDSVTINNGTVGSFAVRSSLEANSIVQVWWNGNPSANQASVRFNSLITRFGSERAGGGLELMYGAATTGLAILSDGRVYGTALHNNASAPTGTTNQYIASGTYTPTLTNTTNISSSNFTDSGTTKWMRVGNVVTVSGGNLNISPTAAAGAQTVLDISFPIASTLGASSACSGVASDAGGPNAGTANSSACIQGSVANNRAQLVFEANNTNSQPWWFTFTYTVL